MVSDKAGIIEFANTLEEAGARLAAGGIALALFDEATVCAAGDDWADGLAAAVASAGTAQTAALWRSENDIGIVAPHAIVGRVIVKPIAGPALRDALYPINVTKRDESDDADLVSNAA